MKTATNQEATMTSTTTTEYDTVCQQIKDAQRLQYNAVMCRDRSGTVSRLDAILEELFRRKAQIERGR